MTLDIGSFNVPGRAREHEAAKLIESLGLDSAGVQEGQGLLPALPIRGMRELYDRHSPDRRRGAKDTLVLTDVSLPSLGTMTLRASKAAAPAKWAPERWITVSCYQHGIGPVAHVNIHPNAVVMDRPKSLGRVREYARHTWALNRVIRFYQREGFFVVVTGDMNWRRHKVAPWSPYRVFRLRGLRVAAHGIDAIAYDRRLRPFGKGLRAHTIPGGDHKGLTIRLAVR